MNLHNRLAALAFFSTLALPSLAATPAEEIAALIDAGQVDAAAQKLADPALAADTTLRNLRLRAALIRQDYAIAEPLARALMVQPATNGEERDLIYTWLFASDDRAEVDKRSRAAMEGPAAGLETADQLAAGKLALDSLDYARAEQCFRAALEHSNNNRANVRDKAAALKGLGQVELKRLKYDESLVHFNASLAAYTNAENLYASAETLIRLARTDEAISAVERAIRLNPYHEAAHYYLGNGYARKNYTQLAAAYGAEMDAAAKLTRGASDAYARGDYDTTRKLAIEALTHCPEYGRAHHALAKGLEMQRYAIDVHRADYERRFAAAPMPVVPGIEKYISNWKDLSPRHQKRVALSVAPWKAFVPVLVAGGSTFFIKPIYMKLSESSGLETLKDQRINTDSRLWDDVRGAGGFTTVTGIEDVERTIADKYNTVLHEMTHQVHQVLTADQARAIQDLYRRAKEREAVTHNAFLSRYASGTVWEYFAEGANAYYSPQRDAYDTRDVVRERLVKLDPDLLALEERYLAITDVKANLPIAYLNAGGDQLSKGHLDKAMPMFDRAVAAAPRDEAVLTGRLNALGIKGDRAGTEKAAIEALKYFPAGGGVQTNIAEAMWHTGHPLFMLVKNLAGARDRVAAADRYLVDLALGGYYQNLGDVPKALAAYDQALAYQADNPEALWGKGATLALAGRFDEAFPFYERAIRLRTGVVELRADYARDLLRAGKLDAAHTQIDAALLLNAKDPTILALDGWLTLLKGDAFAAVDKAEVAMKEGAWSDMARIVKAMALKTLSDRDECGIGRVMPVGKCDTSVLAVLAPIRERITRNTPPSYVYRQISAGYVSVHELPAVEKRLIAEVVGKR